MAARSHATRVTFVSRAALDEGVPERCGWQALVAVATRAPCASATWCTTTTLPHIEVDPQTYEVRADGELLTCEPATVLPLAQRYFLF